MAVRDALKDDAYEMYGMDDDIQSVDLSVWPWNRATIADGQWLQDHAIGPLSARDVYLADCIESANQSINNIEGILQNIGISTGESGANNIGYANKSLHTHICGPTTLTSQSGWDGKSIALVPKNASDSACTPGSISYLTFNSNAQGTTGLPEGFASAAVIQANMYSADAYQLAFTPLGLYYRHINGNTAQGMDPQTEHSYSYVTDPQTFSALTMFDTSTPGDYFVHVAGGKATLSAAAMNSYLQKSEAEETYLKSSVASTTYLTQQAAGTTYQSKCDGSDTNKIYGVKNGAWTAIPDVPSETFTAVSITGGLLAGNGTSDDKLKVDLPSTPGNYLVNANNGTGSWVSAYTQSDIDGKKFVSSAAMPASSGLYGLSGDGSWQLLDQEVIITAKSDVTTAVIPADTYNIDALLQELVNQVNLLAEWTASHNQ